MKRNFWTYLLVFSLALNLGGVVTFGYLHYHGHREALTYQNPPPQPLREIWKTLNLEAAQRRVLEGLLPDHRRRVRDLRAELGQKRFELFEMLKGGAAAWPSIQEKVKEVSALQGKLEEEVLRFSLAFQSHLKPEQKAAFITFVGRRMPNVQGGKGGRSPRWEKGKGAGAPQAGGPCGPE
ncbi:MAG: periplasmic heavy metal sensor [Deltaproteobacteria bacterium]|nr:periplasmic heavy metal sensor [Deltaproteobacteria bacterium]